MTLQKWCGWCMPQIGERNLVWFGLYMVWDQVDRIYIATKWGFRSGTFLESLIPWFWKLLLVVTGWHNGALCLYVFPDVVQVSHGTSFVYQTWHGAGTGQQALSASFTRRKIYQRFGTLAENSRTHDETRRTPLSLYNLQPNFQQKPIGFVFAGSTQSDLVF